MTLIIDHRPERYSTSSAGMVQIMWTFVKNLRLPARKERAASPEHEMLAAMSHYHLRDIGMSRGEVSFGIVSDKPAFE